MSYPIIKKIIPGLPRKPYRRGVGAYEGVVAHSTATPGASAEAEAAYFSRNWKDRKAFVHYFVDWDSIVQTADIDYRAWGAGPTANDRYVHVELCETHDRKKFQESYKRYVWLLAWILYRKRLGVSRRGTFWTHHDVTRHLGGTNHTDPDGYLAKHGVTVAKLFQDVQNEYRRLVEDNDAPKTKPESKPKGNGYPGYLIRRGSTGEVVKKIQRQLKGLAVDGIFGPRTEARVKEFQREMDIGVDGIVGPVTWSYLFPDYPGYLLRRGSRGVWVKRVQWQLGGLAIDGIFGPRTEARVKEFQRDQRIAVDGIVGPVTWGRLF